MLEFIYLHFSHCTVQCKDKLWSEFIAKPVSEYFVIAHTPLRRYLCCAMACFEGNFKIQISDVHSVLSSTICGDDDTTCFVL